MPVLVINTNLPEQQIDRSELARLTQTVARLLNKPAHYVAVQVIPNQILYFAGSEEPAALVELRSIGGISRTANKATALELTEAIAAAFKIQKSRFYIDFHDMKGENISHEGNLFV
jgi:phenylpyruvate tautomerase